jgi:hypothetical protein
VTELSGSHDQVGQALSETSSTTGTLARLADCLTARIGFLSVSSYLMPWLNAADMMFLIFALLPSTNH